MRQAMVFAAGLGTRLRPLTDTMPKALVRVGGEPLLRHVLLRLKDAGFERVVVNIHHFPDQMISYLHGQDDLGLDIRISDERDGLLETGGGIKKALPLFDPESPILIHNVDILSNADLATLYDQAERNPCGGTLLVSQRQTKRYLLFDDDMRLRGWTNIETGEVRGAQAPNRLAFSGIHVLTPQAFPYFADEEDRFGIIDFYLRHCGDVAFRGTTQDNLRLLDVGKLNSLDEAETLLKELKQAT